MFCFFYKFCTSSIENYVLDMCFSTSSTVCRKKNQVSRDAFGDWSLSTFQEV